MSFFDDITPDFSDPNTMAAFGALGGVLQAGTTPRFDAQGRGITGGGKLNALAALTGAGLQGMNQGANFAQQYQAANLANQNASVINPIAQQTAQMNLQRQQALQPVMMNSLKNIGVDPTNLSSTDQMGAMALQMAYGSGDPGKISTAYLSLYEHNPDLAGKIKLAQENNSVHETPQGPQFGVNGLPGASASFGSLNPMTVTSALTNGIVNQRNPSAMGPGDQTGSPTPMPAPPTPAAFGSIAPQQQPQPVNASSLQPPPQAQQAMAQPQAAPVSPTPQKPPISMILATDGKPYVQSAMALPLLKPDPSGTPSYNTPNTTTGVAQTKAFQNADIAGNEGIAESANNTNQMLARLHDINDAYNKAESGTLLAQDPDLANKFIAAGVLTDKGKISDVAQFQRIQGDQALEVLNQLKSATAGSGGSKILNSEVKNATGKLGDPHLQPEAIQAIMAVSEGLGNYNNDMAQGWTKIGGLGNRIAGGYTLRPADYTQQFATSHNLDDYITQAKATMPQIKGTAPDPMASARAAIAKGAPRAAVIKRLTENGIDAGGL